MPLRFFCSCRFSLPLAVSCLHFLLYELIDKSDTILFGNLRPLYLKTCRVRRIKPIALRTYSEYCNKLVDFGLIQAKMAAIQGKVREFNVEQ